MLRKTGLALALLPLLAACAGNNGGPASTNRPLAHPVERRTAIPPTRPAERPPVAGFRTPRLMRIPGITGVIGANEGALTRQFGPPRLNVIEGDAHKLQFSGAACVLDVYLYPLREGSEPVATYVDARRSSDGLDVDRAACIAALLKK